MPSEMLILPCNQKEVYAFARPGKNQTVIVVLHNSEQAQQVSVPVIANTTFTDVLNSKVSYTPPNGK